MSDDVNNANNDVIKLTEENNELKKNMDKIKVDYSKLKDNLTEERVAIETQLEELKAENERIKESVETNSDHDSIAKYKEFLKRAQNEYKSLETELKKEKEKHKTELDKISLARVQTEEKYGQVVKEREVFKEKERIFMETCDALTRLNNIFKKNAETSEHSEHSEPVIDITGEEELGGSTSTLFSCEKCNYKSSQEKNLKVHMTSDHEDTPLPCDLCEFIGKSMDDYNRHIKQKHAEQNSTSKKKTEDKKEESTRKKTKQNAVVIPCDICNFKSSSAEDFIQHIENKHQSNTTKSTEKPVYECGKCDYKSSGEDQFKKHLELAHKLNVGGRKTQMKSRKLCINWNRGHCLFSDCRYAHEEIEACKFNRRCSRPDCKFWHEAQSGKFPFLDSRQLFPRKTFQSQN